MRDDDHRRFVRHSNSSAVCSLIFGLCGFCCGACAGVPAIIFGVFGLGSARLTGTGGGLAIAGICLGVFSLGVSGVHLKLLWPLIKRGQTAVARGQEAVEYPALNTAAEVDYAMGAYEPFENSLPRARFNPKKVDFAEGQGLSWRVGLLPHLQQRPLYTAFAWKESWDSEANRTHSSTVIPQYADPVAPTTGTRFQVFVGPGTAFDPIVPRLMRKGIKDGAENTILFVEAGAEVPWASPRDLPYVKNGPLPAMGKPGATKFVAAYGDGSVRMLNANINPATLHLLILIADGQTIPPDGFGDLGK